MSTLSHSQIEDFLHEQIPLTKAMGIKVESSTEEEFILTAPFSLNHNHIGTAFGGSLSVVATLAAYGLLWSNLGDPRYHLVIRESHLRFNSPVKGTLRGICRRPPGTLMEDFQAAVKKKGKARIELDVTIEEEGRVAVEFRGTFVAVG